MLNASKIIEKNIVTNINIENFFWSLVKENRSHIYFDDYWADTQVRDVIAKNETEARRLVTEQFPPDDGFVIESVSLSQV